VITRKHAPEIKGSDPVLFASRRLRLAIPSCTPLRTGHRPCHISRRSLETFSLGSLRTCPSIPPVRPHSCQPATRQANGPDGDACRSRLRAAPWARNVNPIATEPKTAAFIPGAATWPSDLAIPASDPAVQACIHVQMRKRHDCMDMFMSTNGLLKAIAYFRTSSDTNVGADKTSTERQR